MSSSSTALWCTLLALLAWACAPRDDEDRLRVVSLTPRGTRALAVLGLSDRIIAADAASQLLLPHPVPLATLDDALGRRPDLVLVGSPHPAHAGPTERLRSSGLEVLEVAPHHFEEVFLLYRELARLLGDPARGRAAAHRIGDPVAAVSARQLGRSRPRIAALVDLDPLTLAGGHSFETDLIESAGGESVSHGSEDARVPIDARGLLAAEPDLVIVATPEALSEAERKRVEALLRPLPAAFVTLDRDELWLGGARPFVEEWERLVAGARLAAPTPLTPSR